MLSKKTKKTYKNQYNKAVKRLKHLFVPHKGNKYHPHVIRWQGLAITAVVSLATHIGYGYITTGQFAILGKTVTISTSELQSLTNKVRAENDLAPVEMDSRLNNAALRKAEDMITNNYWSHNSPDGVSPWYWVESSGYAYAVAGENLAKNYADASSVMDAWMSSSAHRDNILNPRFSSVGFAVVDGVINAKINTIVVAYYASPSSDEADVAGVVSPYNRNTEITTFNNPLVYFGGLIKNLSPITIGVLFLLAVMLVAAALTHSARDYVPKNIRKSWKRHHGLYKALGISIVATLLVIISSGSSI